MASLLVSCFQLYSKGYKWNVCCLACRQVKFWRPVPQRDLAQISASDAPYGCRLPSRQKQLSATTKGLAHKEGNPPTASEFPSKNCSSNHYSRKRRLLWQLYSVYWGFVRGVRLRVSYWASWQDGRRGLLRHSSQATRDWNSQTGFAIRVRSTSSPE